MTIWTIDCAEPAGHRRTLIGDTADPAAGYTAALRAIAHLNNQAVGGSRYTVRLDGHLAAVLDAGRDEHGHPNRAGLADILARITANPSADASGPAADGAPALGAHMN